VYLILLLIGMGIEQVLEYPIDLIKKISLAYSSLYFTV